MVGNDFVYFENVFRAGLINDSFLEVGSAKVLGEGTGNLCDLARRWGLDPVVGADEKPGAGVDVVFDFSIPPGEFQARWKGGRFRSVAIFNVLEHTYDPIPVLINALSCVDTGGTLVVVVPSIWGIHSHPKDHLRFLPDWLEEFGSRNGLHIVRELFCFISSFGIHRVDESADGGQPAFPCFINSGRSQSVLRYWTSRIVHRMFNTYGRNHTFTHCSIGCTYRFGG